MKYNIELRTLLLNMNHNAVKRHQELIQEHGNMIVNVIFTDSPFWLKEMKHMQDVMTITNVLITIVDEYFKLQELANSEGDEM